MLQQQWVRQSQGAPTTDGSKNKERQEGNDANATNRSQRNKRKSRGPYFCGLVARGQFGHLEYSEYICRKSVVQTTICDGKLLRVGHGEAIGRQQLMHKCTDGVAGLCGPARREALDMVRAQLVSPGCVRRQMLSFAYRRELGPVPHVFHHTLGLTVQPLTGEANQATPPQYPGYPSTVPWVPLHSTLGTLHVT